MSISSVGGSLTLLWHSDSFLNLSTSAELLKSFLGLKEPLVRLVHQGSLGTCPLHWWWLMGRMLHSFFFCTILWAINNKFMESPLLLHIRVPLLTSLYHFWGLKDLLLWMHWNPETAERTHRESSANFLCTGTVIFPAGFHPRLSDLLLGSSTTSLM